MTISNRRRTRRDRRERRSASTEIRRLPGVEGGFGEKLGLRGDWAYQIVVQVGNYGEVFARHFEPLGLQRGLNALWSEGGLMIAMPYR